MAYVHTLSPYAIYFGSGYGIRWYGLSYLAGFLAAYFIFVFLSKRRLTPLSPQQAGDFVFNLAMGTIIGGRLGYCLLYDQSLFLRFTPHFPFWGVLEIHRGGMASHGGIIGIIIAACLFARTRRLPLLHLLDLSALAGTIGVFFGRLANFINGELVGRAASPGLPWAVKFPQDIFSWPGAEPERLQTLGPVVEKLSIPASRWRELIAADPLSNTVQGILNAIVEAVQSGNLLITNSLAPLLTPRHPSQIYEALLEGLLLFLVLWSLWLRRPRDGIIASSFVVLYAVVRIIGEQFRMPDLQLGFQALGLTRGQWLSLVMLAAGGMFMLFILKPLKIGRSK